MYRIRKTVSNKKATTQSSKNFTKIAEWRKQPESHRKAVLSDGKLWMFGQKFIEQPTYHWGHHVIFGGAHADYFDVEKKEWCPTGGQQFPAISSEEHLDEVLFTHGAEIYLLLYSHFGDFQVHSLHQFDKDQWVWEKVMDFPGWHDTAPPEGSSKNTLLLVNDRAYDGIYFLSYVRHQFCVHLLKFPSLHALPSLTLEVPPSWRWKTKFDVAEISAEVGLYSQLQPTQAAHDNGQIFVMGGVHGCGFRWQPTLMIQFGVWDKSTKFIEIGPDAGDHFRQPSFSYTGPLAHSIVQHKNQWLHFAGQNASGMTGSTFNGEIWAIHDLLEKPNWQKLDLEIPKPANAAHGSNMHIVFVKETGQLYVANEELGVLSATLSMFIENSFFHSVIPI